jgi:DNA repair exonuclease SbcCD nuclease subunit
MAFRFVHSADLHLDSPLRSLALRDPALAELIGTATRTALERIVALCLEERVDALLLAGDLYDGDQTSMKTARFLAEQMRRLDAAGIDAFVIRGNHDNEARITKELVLPERVRVFRGRADCIRVERPRGEQAIAIHGMSFGQRHAPESLLPRYKPPMPDTVNIGLMHTSLGGAEGHDSYAPCALADLQASGYRYWALGHIHRGSVSEGACTVVMPGMPQGRDIGEAGPKSVTLVTVGDDGAIRVEARPVAVAQFETVAVTVAAKDDWDALAGRIDAALGAAQDRMAAEQLVARLAFGGGTELAWRMRADLDQLHAQAADRAAALGRCWIDKVEVRCTAPSAAGADDPLAELRRLIADEIAPSPAFAEELAAIAGELRGQLPPECRGMLGHDAAGLEAAMEGLLGEGVDEVLARLRGPESG